MVVAVQENLSEGSYLTAAELAVSVLLARFRQELPAKMDGAEWWIQVGDFPVEFRS